MNKIQSLQKQIDKIMSLESTKKYSSVISELQVLKKRISDKTFRIAVVGEFSSGKSTFINAFIGKDILKHASVETTATITYIHNVPENDESAGKCVVVFRNGKKEILPNLEKLREYTTVNESVNVAEKIESVSIFTHFLDCAHPIVLTDTPGLNGIADKHREMTLEEIRRAHACIYLLSNNGVKKSDTDFLKVLLNYQSSFIFIQNFIDTLRTSEGETIEKKIQSDREVLNEFFKNANASVTYDIFPISAVKALVARDLSMEKVYVDDIDTVTDRNKLFAESNFTEFAKGLKTIIDSGKYLDIIADSGAFIILKILERLRNGLEKEEKIMEDLIKHDQRNESMDRARQIIDIMQNVRAQKRKNLENFVEVGDSENIKSIKQYVSKSLETLNSEIDSLIDRMIVNYDDIENFEVKNGKSIAKYFSDETALRLNSDIIPKTNQKYLKCLVHLYRLSVLKISDFIPEVSTTDKKIGIYYKESKSDFSFDNDNELEDEKKELEELKLLLSQKQSDLRYFYHNRSELQNKRDDASIKRQNIERDYSYRIAALGSMPDIEQKPVKKYRTVSREGFRGKVVDFFLGKKTEMYYDYEDDYTLRDEWKWRKREFEDERNRKLAECDSKIDRYKYLIEMNEQNITNLEENTTSLEKKKEHLEKLIEQEEENYKAMLAVSKQEYCDNQKRHLKESIRDSLLGNSNNFGKLAEIIQHIEFMSQRNIPVIKKRVLDIFDESYNAKINNLKAIISSSNQELESLRTLSKKDVEKLIQIEKEVKAL